MWFFFLVMSSSLFCFFLPLFQVFHLLFETDYWKHSTVTTTTSCCVEDDLFFTRFSLAPPTKEFLRADRPAAPPQRFYSCPSRRPITRCVGCQCFNKCFWGFLTYAPPPLVPRPHYHTHTHTHTGKCIHVYTRIWHNQHKEHSPPFV